MLATAAPPPVPPAVAVQHNAAEMLIRAAMDVCAARMRMRIAELDRTSPRAMAAVNRTLQQVERIEGECAEIRAALAPLALTTLSLATAP